MADTLVLDRLEAYEGLVLEEKERRLRTYLVLSVTERYGFSLTDGSASDRFRNRAYALQRQHSIGFPGRPSFKMRLMHQFVSDTTSSRISSLIVYDDMDAAGMMGLTQLCSSLTELTKMLSIAGMIVAKQRTACVEHLIVFAR